MQIRMNGQLLLLMLAEKIYHAGGELIFVNTDAVTFKCKKSLEPTIKQIIKEFEDKTGLGFGTDYFTYFAQLAVNDYFGKTDKGEIVEKGSFITSVKLGKGLTPKIIPKAVIKYFLEGIKPEEYIKSCTDIKDFLMSEKTGKQWTVEYNGVKQQRTNRFYASTNGYFLFKYKIEDGVKKYQNMLTSSGITLLNNLNDLKEDPKINYNYYITEANKIIAQFKCKQLSLF